MAYKYRYTVNSQSDLGYHVDGSGMVTHFIVCESQEVDENGDPIGDPDTWVVVGGRSKTFNVFAQDVIDTLNLPSGIVRAYKDLLVANFNTQNIPVTGWTEEEMNLFQDNNKLAVVGYDDLVVFIDSLPVEYPIHFDLDL